jgi:integrase
MARRRGHNEGSIYPRLNADGKIIGYQVQVLLPNRKRKTLGTVRTRREAVQLAQKGQFDLSAGRLSESPRQTVQHYLAAWLEAKQPGIRYKTYVTYRTAIGHAVHHIGNIRLDALRPVQVEQCERALSATKGPHTVEQVHRVLHAAFRRAVQLDLISRNPTDAVIAPRPPKSQRTSLTLPQAQHFLGTTRNDRLHPLYVLLTTTGLRLGEALGLQWRYVNRARAPWLSPLPFNSRRDVDLS